MGLSIAVAAKGQCNPTRFLDALCTECITDLEGVDIHIAHDEPWVFNNPSPLPDNIHLHTCPSGSSIFKLWGIAITQSSQEYVAILDIHCPPKPGWLKRVNKEIGDGCHLFFGPVDPGWNIEDRSIIGYITEYVQFHSPLAEALNEVPGNNLVCHRSLLEPPESLILKGFFKTFMLWKLAREHQMKPERFDDMVVTYYKPFRIGHYLTRRYAHGRFFATQRHQNPSQPPRLMCILFTPLLPVLRCWRIYRAVRNQNHMRQAFFHHFPLILLSESAWSFGELLGYMFNAGDSYNKLD